VNREECSERIRLVDQYSRLITEFSNLLEYLKDPSREPSTGVWKAAETARSESQTAWDLLAKHITEHKCFDIPERGEGMHQRDSTVGLLEKAAMAAIDVILVADDDRKFVEVNDAAAEAFGMTRGEVVGRRIDEFFATAGGETIPAAWNDFISKGAQAGICEMNAAGRKRIFEFRSKANFAPGFHSSVLREVPQT
jgi:PAS domain-containing protein